AREADHHRDGRRDDAGERADDEARAQPVDELRVHVLPRRGRAEPVRRRRRLTRGEAELERPRVGQPGADDREEEEEEDEREPDHELPGAEGEVEILVALAVRRRTPGCDDRAPGGAGRLGLAPRLDRHYEPWIPTRVRGSTTT